MGREDADLATVIENDDGAASHLAAGAGGGRNGHDGYRRRGDPRQAAFDDGELFQRSRMARGHGDGLGQVDGRTPTDGDDAVAFRFPETGDALAGGGLGRIGRGSVEHLVGSQGIQLHQLIDETGGHDAPIGDDQWPLETQPCTDVGQLGRTAGTEADLRYIVDYRHDPSCYS